MSVKISRPLPECRMCATPTKRATWLEHGGLCSNCLEVLASTVRLTRLPPAPDQLTLEADVTAYVERYTPPVPGAES